MAYIESSLMMFRGESHKLLSGVIPNENGIMTNGTYGMVCRDGQIIWEVLGRKGRQIVMPTSIYRNYTYLQSTVIIDIDNESYILQGSVGQYGQDGFVVNDTGIMMISETLYTQYTWNNLSVNGAVFFDPIPPRKLSGQVRLRFGSENGFYGIGLGELENKLIKLTIDEHGMVDNEEVVYEVEGLSRYMPTLKYKGCDFCVLQINGSYYRFGLETHGLTPIDSRIFTYNNWAPRWLTDGKFARLRFENSSIYLAITSDLVNDDKEIYAGEQGQYAYTIRLYCRYPYAYIWINSRVTERDPFVLRIIKINVESGSVQTSYPDSIKIGDVTIYTKESDENGSPQAPYFRLYGGNLYSLFWDYNEYFDDGVLKDDLVGGYGKIQTNNNEYYAVYMDNLELLPSEHNMAILIDNY